MTDKLLSEVTPGDIETARRHLEDWLIELRDMRVQILPGSHIGHGLVVKERDGEFSSIIRLSTAEAIRTAIKAVLDA